jgi:hypothetical protein
LIIVKVKQMKAADKEIEVDFNSDLNVMEFKDVVRAINYSLCV